jgi:hypothetical protein
MQHADGWKQSGDRPGSRPGLLLLLGPTRSWLPAAHSARMIDRYHWALRDQCK